MGCYFSFNIEHFLWDCGCEAAISFISRIFSFFISFNAVRKIVQARHVAEGVTVKGYYPVRCCAVPIFLVQPPYTTSGWVQSLDTWWLTWRNTWHVSTPPLNTGWRDVTSPHATRVNTSKCILNYLNTWRWSLVFLMFMSDILTTWALLENCNGAIFEVWQ